MSGYLEQLDRVRRYYTRFTRINDGGDFDRPVDDLLDDIHAFFQNCYHLKDWLKNDPTFTKATPQQIEQHVSGTSSLAICADICNSTKHLILTSQPRSGKLPSFGNKQVSIDIHETIGKEDTEQRIALKLAIDHGGTMLDAFTVATDAKLAWEAFV